MELYCVKTEDRLSNDKLKPEIREVLKKDIEKYLLKYQQLNISAIKRQVGLSWITVKEIVDEILTEWDEENKSQRIIQAKWYRFLLQEFEENPELLDNKEKLKFISIKDYLLRKINALESRTGDIESISEGKDVLFFKIFGSLSPKTVKLIEEKMFKEPEEKKIEIPIDEIKQNEGI